MNMAHCSITSIELVYTSSVWQYLKCHIAIIATEDTAIIVLQY